MSKKLGKILIALGMVMILSALALFLSNRAEQRRAAAASMEVIPKVVDSILERSEEVLPEQTPDVSREMSVVQIDGQGYIGFVSIPGLELDLPVMADWSYPQLQTAPCRYSGSTFTEDLVIIAHNYEKHFGRISQLSPGDRVTFTDMDGKTIVYEVVARDILVPSAVEELVSGEYDLTLVTCTYGGSSRVTIRCDRT